jgi:hypothetical protein
MACTKHLGSGPWQPFSQQIKVEGVMAHKISTEINVEKQCESRRWLALALQHFSQNSLIKTLHDLHNNNTLCH